MQLFFLCMNQKHEPRTCQQQELCQHNQYSDQVTVVIPNSVGSISSNGMSYKYDMQPSEPDLQWVKVKGKVTFNLKQAMKGQRRRNQRYISSLSLTSALKGLGGQHHAPTALTLRMTRHTIQRRLGGPRNVLDGSEISLTHRDSKPGPFSTQRDAIRTALSRPQYSMGSGDRAAEV